MGDAAPREARRDPLAEQELLTGRLVGAPGLREFQQDIGRLADKDAVLQEPWRRTEL